MSESAKRNHPRLRREIILVILLKLMVLWGLWNYCFSHPVAKSARKTLIEQTLFTNNNR